MQHSRPESPGAREACSGAEGGREGGKKTPSDPLSWEKPPPRIPGPERTSPSRFTASPEPGGFGAPAGREDGPLFSSGGSDSEREAGRGDSLWPCREDAVENFPRRRSPPPLLLPPPSPQLPLLLPPRGRRLSSRPAVRRFLTRRRHLGPRALRSLPTSLPPAGGGGETKGRRRACAKGFDASGSRSDVGAAPRDRP